MNSRLCGGAWQQGRAMGDAGGTSPSPKRLLTHQSSRSWLLVRTQGLTDCAKPCRQMWQAGAMATCRSVRPKLDFPISCPATGFAIRLRREQSRQIPTGSADQEDGDVPGGGQKQQAWHHVFS